MLTLEEVKKKCQNRYKFFLESFLEGNEIFPWEIPVGKLSLKEMARSENIRIIETLKENSRDKKGYGYNLYFETINTRSGGEQSHLRKIIFEDKNNYLIFIKKQTDFENFISDINLIKENLSELFSWCQSNVLKIVDNHGRWADLIKVVNYFLKNPKPELYIRELDIEIHTKFIEDNKAVLTNILEFLIPEQMNKEGENFEEKFHLKHKEEFIRFRILDPELEMIPGINEISLPISQFAKININLSKVFIVENEINFLAFPDLPKSKFVGNSILIWGKGFKVNSLRKINWIKGKQIFYWGDIDLHGFSILSDLRKLFPEVKSFLMDRKTFDSIGFKSNSSELNREGLSYLTPEESDLFNHLVNINKNNRLEQEHIPQKYIFEFLEMNFK